MGVETTWTGGTFKATTAAAWTPKVPTAGDEGVIYEGNVLYVGQTLDYTLQVFGGFGTGDGIGISLNFFQSAIGTATSGVLEVSDGVVGSPDLYFFGNNTNQFTYLGTNSSGNVDVVLTILDVTSNLNPNIAIQPGSLTNSGDITVLNSAKIVGVASGDPSVASNYAKLINMGTIEDFGGQLTIDVPVTGTGTLDASTISHGISHTGPADLVLDDYVGSGQTVSLSEEGASIVHIKDPGALYATIDGLIGGFFSQFTNANQIAITGTVTRATYDGSILRLYDGGALVAHLKLAENFTLGQLDVASAGGQTTVSYNFAGTGGPIPVTSGSGPAIVDPGPPVLTPPRLPAHAAADITLAAGERTITEDQFNGYTVRLEGTGTLAAAPDLAMTFATVGSQASIVVGDASTTADVGRIEAVGYNENHGSIIAEGGGPSASTLALDVENVVNPDGVTVQPGVLNNTCAISALAGGNIALDGDAGSKLINSGTISVLGMAFVGPDVTGVGSMTIGNHAGDAGTLELAGAVATGQSVDLLAGTLTIDDAPHFFATVFDFDARDGVVLKGVDVTNVTYNNGALLLDGGVDGTVHFHRPNGVTFNTGSFLLNHVDGNTIITTPAMT